MQFRIFGLAIIIIASTSCNTTRQKDSIMRLVMSEKFDSTINGKQVQIYTLHNNHGIVAQLTNYGARWISMWVPDEDDSLRDVVLGFDNLKEYITGDTYMGATIGRVCDRINNAQYTLNGESYKLSNNDLFGKPLKNHLHGVFHNRVWNGREIVDSAGNESVVFIYDSPDMEEGYPGTLNVTVTYTLTSNNAMEIKYIVSTDQLTIVNLTNHAYFNLNGEGNGNILGHELTILTDKYVEKDNQLIPTGKIKSVEGTPLDFRKPAKIEPRIHLENSQIEKNKGFAVSYVISQHNNPPLKKVADLFSTDSGIRMEVFSDQPTLEFYNGWLLNSSNIGKQGKSYAFSSGLVLETQQYPDGPNHSNFPSIELEPVQKYLHHAIYRFSKK